jgi:fructose-1,6-bisphosphatase/sedoheptulose 1,7-bisphosphatase-like protein
LEELEARGVEVCRIATDPIDGTSKTVMSEPSALTAILITRGEIRTVPDVYMEKLTLDSVASHAGLTTDDALDKVVQGLADTHKVAPGQINGFALKRDRHPVQPLLDLGINVVLDTDGDLLPGLMPGVQPGVYANGLPLNAMVGNTGGAAEYLIAATANRWAGGASHGRFVSAAGMKAKGWEGRYDFTPEDRSVIEGAGFKVGVNYSVTELVDITDGLAVFAGITSNSHLPQLSGVYVGSNYAQVDVVKVGASGRITKRRFTLHFERPYDAMVTGFDPVTEKLMTCDIRDVRGELRTILADSRRAERLQREIALSLYQIFTIGKGGKFAVQQDRLRELGDERTKAIVGNLMELKPEWFA